MNIEDPLVSILISNYNYDSYLKHAIDSALNQTYSNTEVIVIDDGSTDNSQEVINSFSGRIISIFKDNGGQPSTLNVGFAASQGEIICLLDSDDVWLPLKVEKIVQAFQANSQASAVYHQVQTIDSSGVTKGKPWPPYQSIQGNIAEQVIATGGWWPFPPSTALSFTRHYFCQVMNIPEKEYEPLGADSYLADLAPFFGDIVGINQVLSLYRIHDFNHSKSWNQAPQTTLYHLEQRTKLLNSLFEKFNIDVRLDLTNHLPYQQYKYKLDGYPRIFHLSSLAFRNPWEPKLIAKLKAVIKLWLEMLRYSPFKLKQASD